MHPTRPDVIAALLREAKSAHGAYEATVLGGICDGAWSIWYANYLLDHGLSEQLGGEAALTVDRLADMLSDLAADDEREQPPTPWTDAYARAILAQLG